MKTQYPHLDDTLRLLATSPNEAVVPVLLAALDSDEARIREGAFPILLQRRSPDAENEILRRWSDLSEHWKHLIARREDWLSPAIRRAVMGTDVPLAILGCAAGAFHGDYELIPVLVSVICEKRASTS